MDIVKKIEESSKSFIRKMTVEQYKKYKLKEKLYNKKYYSKKIIKMKKEDRKIIISFD